MMILIALLVAILIAFRIEHRSFKRRMARLRTLAEGHLSAQYIARWSPSARSFLGLPLTHNAQKALHAHFGVTYSPKPGSTCPDDVYDEYFDVDDEKPLPDPFSYCDFCGKQYLETRKEAIVHVCHDPICQEWYAKEGYVGDIPESP